MNSRWPGGLFLSLFFVLPNAAFASETAQARFWCLSLHFQTGTDSFGDTLDFSTISETANGELAPASDGSYVSGFSLDLSGAPIPGTAHLNLPPLADANSNGWDDFFEVSQEVSATTSGTYTTALGNGKISASWNRGAGSKDGTCVLTLTDNQFGSLGSFRHTFELIEYTGPLTFNPGSNVVNGVVNLTKSGDTNSQIHGPVQFVKNATNRFNLLALQAGSWTNTAFQTLTFTNEVYLRDLNGWFTNYYGYVEFDDGEPSTSSPDYWLWMLSIDDPNDANRNGIPDFSDDPANVPLGPTLALAWNATNLMLTVNGTAGRSYQLQQTTALPATNWLTAKVLTLTNSPQSFPLPLPISSTSFWRLVAQ